MTDERTGPSREALASAFRLQARGCAQGGSPIYAALLERAADDIEVGGPCARALAGYRGSPVLDAVALRLLGAVHRLVLSGRAPRLAAFYPSAGGRFEIDAAWPAFLEVLDAERDFVEEAHAQPVQTHEVQRSAALLGGFLRIADRTRRPLRVLEVGANAGLNLRFDRYAYALGPHRWGDPSAALLLSADWEGPAPDLDAPLRVASRAGCDLAPIDVGNADQCLRLASFVWPDQLERRTRLEAALAIARRAPLPIEAEGAGPWLERQLASLPEGRTTVLFHSVVWWYLPEAERERVTQLASDAARRASDAAPFAWLRLEGAAIEHAELRLALWPGGDDRLLAKTHWHGSWIHWLAD